MDHKAEQKTDVTIAGFHLTLKGDFPVSESQRIARFVDSKINEALENNPRLGTQLATVLACVNIAGELFMSRQELRNLKEISREPMENYELLSGERDRQAAQNQALEQEIARLKDDLVNSLNTIGDINKRMTNAAQTSEDARRILQEKQEEMKRVEQSLVDLRDKNLELIKENAELKQSIVYNQIPDRSDA